MTKTKFRITGVLLTIAILLATFSSFAIPAFAAESEPIISGGNEGEVSGNFNPEIAFTDINVIDEEDIVYYEKDGVYIVVILPDKSAADFPNMQLVGTNLEYLDKDNVLLQVKSSVYASYGDYYEPDFIEPLEYLIEENFLLYNWSGMRDGSWTEYCYSNDGGNTWSDVIRFEAKQSYTITNDTSDTNGTVTIPSYSVAGETVNVDVSPTYGYRLDTLTVTDAKGNPVIVENKAFTMPTSAVTVNAVFAVCDHSSNQHVEFDDKGFCVNNCGAGYEPALLNADGYYEINNAGNLYWFAQLVNIDGVTNANAILMNDIDLENRVWYPIGLYNDIAKEHGELVRKQYAGILNGNNHTISNFKAIGNGSQGLIGYSDRNAQVRNLGVINATVSGWNAGAIIAYSGIIENCYAINCKITAYTSDSSAIKVYAGAVAGSQQATLKNCFAYNCEIIVGEGYENKSTIAPVGGKTPENCYYANVTATNGTFRINENEMNALPAQLEIGEVAYLLGSAWGMGETGLPTLGKAPVTEGYSIYGQQLNIGGDLAMKYYVIAFGDEIVTKDLTMEFFFLGKKTEVIGFYDSETRMYVFTLDGINPQCMGDKIDAYLLLDGEEKANKLDYTVEANLLTLREKYKDDTALVTLVNDILAYGSAASEYKGYGSMTDDYVSSDREIPTTNVAPSDAFTGYTVTFGQMNYIKIRVNLADGNTLYLGETDITNELVDGVYKTAGIAPTDFDKVFTFTVKNGDETVATFALSVNDYISAKKDSESMGNLVKALYNYGVSAEIYNHIKAGNGEHIYAYTDNGDGTHSKMCACGNNISSEAHTAVNHICTDCGAMEIVVSFDAGDYEWKTGDTLYFCRVSRDNEWEEYCFTATVAEDGTVTWTPDKPLYWDGTGEHSLIVSYPANMGLGWDDFAIPTDQSTPDLLREADCMNARWAGTPTTNVINFELKHRMAKITVKYVLASQFDGMEDVTAKIYSNAKYCIFSDADGLPIITSAGQYDAWITPYYAEQDIVGYHYFTVYVTPGEYNTDGLFKFYIDGAEVQIEIGNPGDVTLEEGGEYTFEVKVGKDKVNVWTEYVTISGYPGGWTVFAEENLNAETIIGTPNDGKNDWAVGDQVFVTLHSDYFGTQTYVYTYDGNGWEFEDDAFRYLEDEVPTVTAIYAPCYEYDWWNELLVLADGMQLGMTEYIVADCEMDNFYSIDVNFENAIRTYSRLRIVGQANTTYTVTVTDFTPAGTTETGTYTYTLTTDKDGNTYLYGTLAEDATVTVEKGDVTLTSYTFAVATESNKSYVLEARAVIDGTLGGKTEATEEDLAAMVELLRSYIESGNTTIIVTGNDQAKLLKDGYLIPVVSLAFEQLTYAYQDENIDSYWGTVDLIYRDVTEIVEYEFYVCDVLKSITLPKVTTVGDRGFWACYYLETLTFGSVVTNITDNSGEVFYDLGYKIGGCNLVLNCGQLNTATEYQPYLDTRTWWNTEWKSITLTHTGECDECKANQ